jgi:hypothetical protein
VPKCGLPPPIECTQRRCCVTDRSLGKCSSISILYYFGNVQIWSSRMAGLAWSAPVSCVALSMSWSARRAARGHAPDAGCLRHPHPNATLFWSVIAPADGTRTATAGKRRLRYVCVFWAALGQAVACLYLITWGAGRKAQWLVEN